MADEARPRAWLTAATADGRRPLAASLPVTGGPPATSWLPVPVSAASFGAAAVPPCPGCADLERLQAELVGERVAAATRGRDEGLAETVALRGRLASVVTALAAVRTEREAALTETIVYVALGLCEWLAAGGDRDLILRLNGDDAAELGTQVPAGVVCEVVADLAPGEVWVEAPRLVVDARWPTRLAALREPLLALLRAAAPDYEPTTADDRRGGES